MPAQSVVKKIAVNLVLNNGTTKTGAAKFANVPMGTMSISGFDADKAIAVASLISSCLENTLVELRKIETSMLTN